MPNYFATQGDLRAAAGYLSSFAGPSGTVFIYTGFPVTSATVSFASMREIVGYRDEDSPPYAISDARAEVRVQSYQEDGFTIYYEQTDVAWFVLKINWIAVGGLR